MTDETKETFFMLLCSECGDRLGYSINVDARSDHLLCNDCYLDHQDEEEEL